VSEPAEPDDREQDREPDDGLFLTDAQIIRRLGWTELDQSGTPSSRRSRKRSGEQS
jgi:hypothetical protein